MATRTELEVGPLRSLVWAGDDLCDWIGGKRIRLDGTVIPFGSGHGYRFDSAVGLDDHAVVFETLGTKGRLARWNGELPRGNWIPLGIDEIREIDRSYYQAEVYAFPACLFGLPDGRTAIAHCPVRYDTLEIELLDGTPLTRRPEPAEDVFHSRLAASPDGRWLLSAGWVWQPWNVVCVYDTARALVEPAHLSSTGVKLDLGAAFEGEADAGVLLGDRVVVAGSPDAPALSVVELPSGRNLACIPLSEALGTRLMAWGPDQVVALDGRPRVVALDGTVTETFDVQSGAWQQPSVSLEPPTAPWVAIDPRGARFAVGDADGRIVVIAR